ncbi:ATP-binding cassette domain-containing protein [Ochrobactrum sp. S1502_03]|uniref:ATP-binding cassette domain-containing protein n=1 Tax=Ochrobactrum sp. S1502_03 TaxID=3108451 RepID=UPI0037CC253D
MLDEPTASLDAENKAAAIRLFKEQRNNRSQLLITHDIEVASALADRIGVLRHGRLVETGRTGHIFADPKHAYTRSLVRDHIIGDRPAPKGRAATHTGLVVSKLSHSFGEKRILKEVDLYVPAGSSVAIMGASGVGKSTMARLLTGFEPIQSGQCLWRSGETADETAPRSVLVSQKPHAAMASHFTVEDVLAEGLILAAEHHGQWRVGKDSRKNRIRTLLTETHLPTNDDFLERRVSHLSGGEAQKLVIARALIFSPDVIVADEPTAALDMIAKRQIVDLLDKVRQRRNAALVLFTHDRAIAALLGETIRTLENGQLLS